jgi:uncharacterized membrane protein
MSAERGQVREPAFAERRPSAQLFALPLSADLVVVFGLALLLILTLAIPHSIAQILRVPVGLAMALFAPGYVLSIALIPRRTDLDGIARIALGIGLSVALIPAFAFALDQLPWGIRVWPIAITISTWVFAVGAVAAWRQRGIAPESEGRGWRSLRLQPPRLILTLAVIALLIAGLGLVLSQRSSWQPTEFYALGASGMAEEYPRQVSTTDDVTVTIGIVNGVATPVIYRIEVWAVASLPDQGRSLVATVEGLHVGAGARYEAPLTWQMPYVGDNQRAELLLFAGNDSEPLRHLELWMRVVPAS